jgi:uncharacterized protein involved in exopolysaccharide biosynthesis
MQIIERPGLHQRAWAWARRPRKIRSRHRRYFATASMWVLLVWALTFAYLLLAPNVYRSQFTLILPGSGAGSTLNVESIGQAQSAAASAFSSPTLSPTENYKRLLMTESTLSASAGRIGEEPGAFPAPRISLIDQTNLIAVEMNGSTPEQAQQRAEALKASFLKQLDDLRADEAKKRESGEAANLIALEKKVRLTQQALLDFQAETGLVSLDQFNQRIANIDALRGVEREARMALRAKTAQASSLSGTLRMGKGGANQALRLASDPLFLSLADRYAKFAGDAAERAATLGDEHDALRRARAEEGELKAALVRRGRQLTGLSPQAILNSIDINVGDGRSRLMQDMVVHSAESAGASASLAEIRRDIAREAGQSKQLVEQASKLADLVRDHRVAEAVFSSALARLDTNKQDPFASYPLVQTLEPPSLPKDRASPSTTIALAGAMAASIFIFFGLALLWYREAIIARIKPNF